MQITTLLPEEGLKTDPMRGKVQVEIEGPMKGKETQVMIKNKDLEVETEEKAIIEEDQMKEETQKGPMNQETEVPALRDQGQLAETTKETPATTDQDQIVEGDITMKEDLMREEKPEILMTQEIKTQVMRDKTETDHLAMINRDQIVKPEAEPVTEEVNITKQ